MQYTLENLNSFNPVHTFDCGQCFRWNRNDDGSFTGVAHGRVIKVSYTNNNFTLYNTNLQEFNLIWSKYFDIERDYDGIRASLAIDDTMRLATDQGSGIRILRQDTWETVVSFIISASNNIPRIKHIVEELCRLYGKKIYMDGQEYYTFPSPQDLFGIEEGDLAPIKSGFRAKYIVDAVKKANDGSLDFAALEKEDIVTARNMLLEVKGIGNKVADCILLFGCGRFDVFPVDTWIKKAMTALYPAAVADAKTLAEAGEKLFGKYCGLAQQYLFYYARENKLTLEDFT
ncbi:MAG: DNA-3-methyladenine glycosylase 2 family protein [Clostridia bacterium]|nr:DNA-3-methyladenine glycosylase 2 family protein [Clostridia bacterium]